MWKVRIIPKLLRPLTSLHDRIRLFIDHLYTLQTYSKVIGNKFISNAKAMLFYVKSFHKEIWENSFHILEPNSPTKIL